MILQRFFQIGLIILLHLNAQAALPGDQDTQFNAPPFNGSINTMAVDRNGKILVGGSFTTVGTNSHKALVRLNADGTLDETFLLNFSPGETNVVVHSLLIRPNGRVLIGGTFKVIDGHEKPGLAQLNEDESIDPQFNLDSSLAAKAVFSLTLQADGKLWAGGIFRRTNSQPDRYIVRLDESGIVDLLPELNLIGRGNQVVSPVPPQVTSIRVQPDGGILLGGEFLLSTWVGLTRFDYYSLIRLLPNGTHDTAYRTYVASFDPLDFLTRFHPRISALGLLEDNRLLVAGAFNAIAGETDFGLARLNPDASYDPSFETFADYYYYHRDFAWGIASFQAILPLPDGKTLVGGRFSYPGNIPITNIALLNSNGSVDTTFRPKSSLSNIVSLFTLQNDGKVLVAGSKYLTNNTLEHKIERLHMSAEPDSGPPAFSFQPQDKRATLGGTTVFNALASGKDLNYQWNFNATPIVGETNDTLIVRNITREKLGLYSVTVTNELGTATSASATLILLDLSEALDSPDLVWRTGGFTLFTNGINPEWVSQSLVSYDGQDAARSAILQYYPSALSPQPQESWIETTVTGPGVFKCRVKIDQRSTMQTFNSWIVGETNFFSFGPTSDDWMEQRVYVPAGSHTIRLRTLYPYLAVYLDQAQFTKGEPVPPPNLQIRRYNQSQFLIWSDTYQAKFIVEGAEELEAPNWETVELSPLDLPNRSAHLVPFGQSKRFFRLKLP